MSDATGRAAKGKPQELPRETLDFFGGDDLRARVFHDKYALRSDDGRVLERTPEEMWYRVGREIASVEATPDKRAEWEKKFYWLLEDFRFIPGGRIMHGAGNQRRVTLLNCYVIPVHHDDIESIFGWMKEAARTYSFGGGVGVDISILRPRGAPVHNAALTSTGSVSFMELFSLTTGTIGQSGRRGALMITIEDRHPDVLDFIKIKRNLNRVRYANISVRVSDAFMKAVEEDTDWELYFENDRAALRKKVRARDVWAELIKGARDFAEPGLIFWDTIKRWSTSEYNGMGVITTNPCSEIPLEPYGNCCLGNLCLSAYVQDAFTAEARVDWTALERGLRYATRFLDDVLDYNADKHPLPGQRQASLYSRRIGVGFTALGDMLIKLGLKYDTQEAAEFVDRLYDRIKNIVYDESVNLGIEKGTFPGYDRDPHMKSPFIQSLDPAVQERIRQHGLRNVALLTVPPVGSGAALAGVTSGIEPIFDLTYVRRSESLSQEFFHVQHPLVKEYVERFGLTVDAAPTDPHYKEALRQVLPPCFVTAHEISADMRVLMQATIQRHIDHAISSTVNLPRETTPEEVARIYFLAWKAGCKGITVYREGSREGILITDEQAKETLQPKAEKVTKAAPAPAAAATSAAPVASMPAAATPATAATGAGALAAPETSAASADTRPSASPRPRPKVTFGRTERLETPRGRIYVSVNEDELGLCEVFVESLDVEAEAIGRLASLALRAGVDAREVIEQLWRVQSKEVALDRGTDGTVVRVTTIAQAVALALGRALYGEDFRPDKEFPKAESLPEPGPRYRQQVLPFAPKPAPGAETGEPARAGEAAGSAPVAAALPAPVAGGNGQAKGDGETLAQAARSKGVPLEFVGVCPDCGAQLSFENGCCLCRFCGYSRC